MQFDYLPQKYKNSIDCARSFYRTGGMPKLYKGLVATMARDIPQYAGIRSKPIYFIILVFLSSYEMMKQQYQNHYKTEDTTLGYEFLAGCISGFLCICVSYPQDMIRTRVMCESDTPKHLRKYKSKFMDGGVMSCAKYIYRRSKLRGRLLAFYIF